MKSGSSGRRPGASGTRDAILAAARSRFAQHGYDGTTLRAVAADAGVDVALVSYFHGSKEGLFRAAMELRTSPVDIVPAVLAAGVEGAGERLVRRFLEVWDDPADREPLLALIRSAAANEGAARTLREFVGAEMVGRISAALEGEDRELRATLAGSQMVGLIIERYVLEVEPLASASHDAIASRVGANLQRYLDP
ncbi:MAG: hypothetical protein AVDCRST_MAG30-2238 [uncultured Solirubrobacteraceae bacterium]|uniref:HTH tetR-type domain-containing protein n=1 Tax=uncultured Solirubrobacteraceae bacterium TaxID=1162706 RepID=A0A6J4SVY1_9ACTN|nr:MAG: hypothetical protein AVDCRST_MAG30-2238 [uncultured Solirubrobacteraceae bacterium]